VSKLRYFAVNEHTKYKPIRCELHDNDKYRVKNPQWLSGVPLRGYDITHSGWGVQQAAAVCTALPYDAGIFLFPTTTRTSLVNSKSCDHHSANQNYVSLVVISAS